MFRRCGADGKAWLGASSSGQCPELPLPRLAVCAVTGIYLVRGIASAPLMAWFRRNSATFRLWSSAICLRFGVIHPIGLRQVGSRW